MGLLSQLGAWWSRVHLRARNEPAAIQWDQTGITQTSGTGDQVRLIWDQINLVFDYKRDFFAFDQIRLIMGDGDLKSWIEVAKGDPGYEELISDLPDHLSGCPPADSWFERVALPPFATQWTKIYDRQAMSG